MKVSIHAVESIEVKEVEHRELSDGTDVNWMTITVKSRTVDGREGETEFVLFGDAENLVVRGVE